MTHATALLLTAALLTGQPVPAPTGGSQDRTSGALLDLPYLTQTDQLCGGAALAMVLRYWGIRDVFAEDFAPLVDDRERGIRTSVLAGAAADRGLDVVTAAPDASRAVDWIRDQLTLGRPVIALIEERARLYHYVVVAGVTDELVVFHDPARAPYRVLSRAEFETRWTAAGRWVLLSVPKAVAAVTPRTPGVSPRVTPGTTVSPCQALVAASVDRAQGGDTAGAEAGLMAATTLCPDSAEGWVELAGLRFLDKRYAEAGALASRALQQDPNGEHAWRILGTTEFLGGDLVAALGAWNHLGEPTADVVAVEGAARTPHPVVVRATGLTPRTLLTPAVYERATRRLRELPVTSGATVRYQPQPGGTASVTAIVNERPPYPSGLAGWVAVGMNTAFLREVRISLFGLAHQGDAIDVAWRFRHNRPRVRGELAIPMPGPLPGVIALDAVWERQAYSAATVGRDTLLREERRRTSVRWSDWATGWLRWQVGSAFDRFDDRRFGSVEAQVGTRWFRDHVSTRVMWAHWMSPSHSGFSSAELSGAWRSSVDDEGWGWLARSGIASVTSGAPLSVWPLASSSSSRGALLRGRGLYDQGIVTTGVMGRRLSFTTVEYAHLLRRDPIGSVGVAGFIDIGQAWLRSQSPDRSDWQFDVGAGLRLKVPAITGQIRLDAGYATRTGRASLSAGYVIPWGS